MVRYGIAASRWRGSFGPCGMWQRAHVLRLYALFAGLAWFLGGCRAFETKSNANNAEEILAAESLGIRFEYPQNNSVVVAASDLDPALEGIQVDVRVLAADLVAGSALFLSHSRNVDATNTPRRAESVVGEDGVAVFSRFTLPEAGEVVLLAGIAGSKAPCNAGECATVAISISTSHCLFVRPIDGLAPIESTSSADVLNITLDAYPEPDVLFDPVETDLVLECTGIAEGTAMEIVVAGYRVAEASLVEGRASFVRAPLPEGRSELRAQRVEDGDLGPRWTTFVEVDTDRCEVQLWPDVGTVFRAADDVDLGLRGDGMQTTLRVSSDCSEDAQLQLFVRRIVDGVPGAFVAIEGFDLQRVGDASNRFWLASLVSLPEDPSKVGDISEIDVVAHMTDAAADRSGSSLITSYGVASSIPQLVEISPAEGACLSYTDDEDAVQAGVQTSLLARAGDAVEGAEVWVRAETIRSCIEDSDCIEGALCREDVCTWVAAVDADGVARPAVTLVDGMQRLFWSILDQAGNASDPSQSIVNLEAYDAVPSILAPGWVDGAVYTADDDVDLETPGLQIEWDILPRNLPEGSSAAFALSGQESSFDPYTVFRIRKTLAPGAHTVQASITHPCGLRVQTPLLTVHAVAEPAAVQVVAWASGGSPLLGDPTFGSGAILAAEQVDLDVTLGLGAAARNILLSTTTQQDPVSGLCVDATPAEGSEGFLGAKRAKNAISVAADETGVRFLEQDLLPGITCFRLEIDDGLQEQEIGFVLQRRAVASAPEFENADEIRRWDLALDDADAALPGFQRSLVVHFEPPTDLEGILTLQIEGVQDSVLARQPVGVSVATQTLNGITLPQGSHSLVWMFEDSVGAQASSAKNLEVEISGTGPQVAWAAPLGPGPIRNDDLMPSIQLLSDGLDVAACSLFVDDALVLRLDPSDSRWGNFPVEPLILDAVVNVSAVHGEDKILQAMCEDVAGGVGFGPRTTVLVDDSAPDALAFVDRDGESIFATGFLPSSVPDTLGGAPGIQIALQADLPNVANAALEGWQAVLRVCSGGDLSCNEPLESRVYLSGAEPIDALGVATVLWPFADMGTLSGSVFLQAHVLDAAGNASDPTTATLMVDRNVPVVTQVLPDPTQTLLTDADGIVNLPDPRVALLFLYDISEPDGTVVTLDFDPRPDADSTGGAPFPLLATSFSSQVRFPVSGFLQLPQGEYTTTVRLTDIAGNTTTHTSAMFEVLPQTVGLFQGVPEFDPLRRTLLVADDAEPSTPGMQLDVSYLAEGFAHGTPAHICATVSPVGLGNDLCPDGVSRLGDVCRFASNGRVDAGGDAGDQGVIVRCGFDVAVLGDVGAGLLNVLSVALAEGNQVLHAEAEEADGEPSAASEFQAYYVDSTQPSVTQIQIHNDDAANNAVDGTQILNAAELEAKDAGIAAIGCPASAQGQACVSVQTVGVEDGRPVQVRFDDVVLNTDPAIPVLSAGVATFLVTFPDGEGDFWAETSDAAGNPNDVVLDPKLKVEVDTALPSIVLDTGGMPAVYGPSDGEVLGNDLRISLGAQLSDDRSLLGGKATLRRFSAASGGVAQESREMDLSLDALGFGVTFADMDLASGVHFFEAELSDAAGNISTLGERLQVQIDLEIPSIALEIATTANVVDCDAALDADPVAAPNSRCILDVQIPNGGLAVLDVGAQSAGTDGTGDCGLSPDGLTCHDEGSQLRISVSDCPGSATASFEACSDVEMALVTRPASGGSFAVVPGSTVLGALSGDISDQVFSVLRQAVLGNSWGLPGRSEVQELRVRLTDPRGNVAESPSRYYFLDYPGVGIDVERAQAPSDPQLQDNDILGLADDKVAGGVFTTDLRVVVTTFGDVDLTANDAQASLSVNGGAPTTALLAVAPGGGSVVFSDIELVLGEAANTLEVTVTCGVGTCSGSFVRTYTGIGTDNEAPSYDFRRCGSDSLDALGVAFSGACPDALPGTLAGVGPHTSWGLAQSDGGSAPFRFDLAATLNGVDVGQTVELIETRGAQTDVLASQTATAGCETSCDIVFSGVEINDGSPSISLKVVDDAGNTAEPSRAGDGPIVPLIDTDAPQTWDLAACFGDVVQGSGAGLQDAACLGPTGHCSQAGASCDRLLGDVTLAFVAPDEDGTGQGGDRVAGFEVFYAGLSPGLTEERMRLRYPMPDPPASLGSHVYTDCDALMAVVAADPSAAANQVEGMLSVPASVDPGLMERVAVSGLAFQRDYCFVVRATDAVGNVRLVSQHLPLVALAVDGPDGTIGNARLDLSYMPQIGADQHSFYDFGSNRQIESMEALGDFDGDGRVDFAAKVAQSDQSSSELSVFLSSQVGTLQYPISLENAGVHPLDFASSFAGGDVDGDGLDDLVVCNSDISSGEGSLNIYWGNTLANLGLAVGAAPTLALPGGNTQPAGRPDKSLFGGAGIDFCRNMALGDVTKSILEQGGDGADIVVATSAVGQKRIYGLSASQAVESPPGSWLPDPNGVGSAACDAACVAQRRARFDLWSDPADAVAAVLDPSAGSRDRESGGDMNGLRPDFILGPPVDGHLEPGVPLNGSGALARYFPQAMALADVNGDGMAEIAASDWTDASGQVFGGAVLLHQALDAMLDASAPEDAASGSTHALRQAYDRAGAPACSGEATTLAGHGIGRFAGGADANFVGSNLWSMPAPVAGVGGDWLAVQATANRVFVLQAGAGRHLSTGCGGLVRDDAVGPLVAVGPALKDQTPHRVSNSAWDRTIPASIYPAKAEALGDLLGLDGREFLVSWGGTGDEPLGAVIYAIPEKEYESVVQPVIERAAILLGSRPFGHAIAVLGDHLVVGATDFAVANDSQIFVFR